MSNSYRPHGLQPTSLLRPWDFPGKSTRVGCHCLLRPTPGYIPKRRKHEFEKIHALQCSSVQLLSCVQFFVTPWTAARQAYLSITNSWSLLKLMSIELVIPSNYLILCCPLPLPPSIFPSIRVFSNDSALHTVYNSRDMETTQVSINR